jgi:hypothetical protein
VIQIYDGCVLLDICTVLTRWGGDILMLIYPVGPSELPGKSRYLDFLMRNERNVTCNIKDLIKVRKKARVCEMNENEDGWSLA